MEYARVNGTLKWVPQVGQGSLAHKLSSDIHHNDEEKYQLRQIPLECVIKKRGIHPPSTTRTHENCLVRTIMRGTASCNFREVQTSPHTFKQSVLLEVSLRYWDIGKPHRCETLLMTSFGNWPKWYPLEKKYPLEQILNTINTIWKQEIRS